MFPVFVVYFYGFFWWYRFSLSFRFSCLPLISNFFTCFVLLIIGECMDVIKLADAVHCWLFRTQSNGCLPTFHLKQRALESLMIETSREQEILRENLSMFFDEYKKYELIVSVLKTFLLNVNAWTLRTINTILKEFLICIDVCEKEKFCFCFLNRPYWVFRCVRKGAKSYY